MHAESWIKSPNDSPVWFSFIAFFPKTKQTKIIKEEQIKKKYHNKDKKEKNHQIIYSKKLKILLKVFIAFYEEAVDLQ